MRNNPFFKNKKIMLPAIVLVLLVILLVCLNSIPDTEKNDGNEKGIEDSTIHSGVEEPETKSVGLEEFYDQNPDFLSSGLSHHETVNKIYAKIGTSEYSLENKDGIWQAGENVPVSGSSILRLAVSLCSLGYEDKIDATDADPLSCGITDESDYVRFDNIYGISVQYTLGNPVVGTELYYIKTSMSDDIYMVDKSSVSAIFRPLDAYRNDKLQRVDFENIAKIYFKNSTCEFKLEKRPIDKDKDIYYEWSMTYPYSILARDYSVNDILITPASALEASEYVSDDGDFENYGLAEKENMVIFEDVNGKGQTLYFSELINNSYYICIDDNPNIYKADATSVAFAKISVIDIADRVLYLTKRENLSRITISGEDVNYKIEFVKTGDESSNMIVINGVSVESNDARSELFRNICGLYADDVISSVSGQKSLVFVFEKTDGSKTVLDFYADGERYYSVCKNSVPIYSILKSKVDNLFKLIESNI